MLIGVNGRVGLPTSDAVIQYKLAFPGEGQGFINNFDIKSQKLLLSYTAIADKLGFVEQGITGVLKGQLNKSSPLLNKVINIQKLSTSVVGYNESALNNRAVTLSMHYGLNYFTELKEESRSVNTKQVRRLMSQLGYKPIAADSALGLVTEVVQSAYSKYIDDRNRRRKTNNEHIIGFKEFVDTGHAGASIIKLEEKYNLVSELTRGSDRIVGVPLRNDSQLLTERIHRQLSFINQRSMAALKETYNANIYKEFISGGLSLENKLLNRLSSSKTKEETSNIQRLLSEVQKTKQIVLPQIRTSLITSGEKLKKGDIVLHVSGSAQSILKAERLVLNIIQRMSGIATFTHQMNELIAHTSCKLLDTRKTTPGFRYFEKLAVLQGGGVNHRFGLFDMIMIKDNHIDFAGGIEQALKSVVAYQKENNLNLQVEIETRNIDEVNQVLKSGIKVQRIMLDNYSTAQLKEAVVLINGVCETEASGGIDENTIKAYAETGVNFISMGALTHSYKSLDLSLKSF
jgi:nicotinate-nucleotide pyrophosphorylase (carboxylating)